MIVKQTAKKIVISLVMFAAVLTYFYCADLNDQSRHHSVVGDKVLQTEKFLESETVSIAVDDENRLLSDDKANKFSPSNIQSREIVNKDENGDAEVKLLASAKKSILSENVDERIEGMLYLTSQAPSEAANSVDYLLSKMEENPNVQGAAIVGMLRLAQNSEALPNEKLAEFYHGYSNDNVRGRVARVLSYRGDNTLLKDYIQDINAQLQTSDVEGIVSQMKKLQTLESKEAVSAIAPFLTDADENVRLAALDALTRSGNVEELELIRPMLLDGSVVIQKRAEMAMNYFLDMGDSEPTPTDIMMGRHPQQFVAN